MASWGIKNSEYRNGIPLSRNSVGSPREGATSYYGEIQEISFAIAIHRFSRKSNYRDFNLEMAQ